MMDPKTNIIKFKRNQCEVLKSGSECQPHWYMTEDTNDSNLYDKGLERKLAQHCKSNILE